MTEKEERFKFFGKCCWTCANTTCPLSQINGQPPHESTEGRSCKNHKSYKFNENSTMMIYTKFKYTNPGTFVQANALDVLSEAPPPDFTFLDPPYEDIELIRAAIALALGRRIYTKTHGAIVCFMWLKDVPKVFKHTPFDPDDITAWEKPASTKNTARSYSHFLEAICVWHGSFFNKDLHWANRTGIFVDRLVEKPPFNHKKPDTLAERLVKLHTPPGGKVIDAFAGTGTVKDVCDRCGFLSLSSDLDPKGKLAKISPT